MLVLLFSFLCRSQPAEVMFSSKSVKNSSKICFHSTFSSQAVILNLYLFMSKMFTNVIITWILKTLKSWNMRPFTMIGFFQKLDVCKKYPTLSWEEPDGHLRSLQLNALKNQQVTRKFHFKKFFTQALHQSYFSTDEGLRVNRNVSVKTFVPKNETFYRLCHLLTTFTQFLNTTSTNYSIIAITKISKEQQLNH